MRAENYIVALFVTKHKFIFRIRAWCCGFMREQGDIKIFVTRS